MRMTASWLLCTSDGDRIEGRAPSLGRAALVPALAAALAALCMAPSIGQAQMFPPLGGANAPPGAPIADGKMWKYAVASLTHGRLYRPTVDPDTVGTMSFQGSYSMLVLKTPEERLIAMLEDPSPTLRIYAFWALSDRGTDPGKLFNIAFDKLSDEGVSYSGGGCMVTTRKVGDAVMSSIVKQLTDRQRRRVLDYLFYEPHGLDLLDEALRSWTIPESYRGTLRHMVENGRSPALWALSKFKDGQDVPFIAKNTVKHRETAFSIMMEQPHDLYFAALEKAAPEIIAEQWPSYNFYRAVAAHGSERAVPIMRMGLEKSGNNRSTHAGRIFSAATEAGEKDAGFMPLLWSLWERDGRLDDASFELMWKQDKKRSQRLMRETLRKGDLEDISGGLLVRMLRLSSGRRANAIDAGIWSHVLNRASYFHIDVLTNHIRRFKPPGAIEPLFKRLESHESMFMHVPVVGAILAYGSDEVTARLQALIDSNKHLREGWAGERIAELLRQRRGDK